MTKLGEKVISLHNVGACYGGMFSRKRKGYWALSDVSFSLHRGETVGIVGRNGAGKSTLMRLLAGIIEPDRGEIINSNVSVQLLALQVGFDGQLSGRANAIMSGMLLGMRKQKIINCLPEIIDFSNLEDFIDQPVNTYSNGMKARLGFAIACQANPDVLLIDEILSVGDGLFRHKSQRVLKERITSNETVVIVSHQDDTLRELCDRIVWIEDGVTRMEGGAEEVLQAYNEYLLDQLEQAVEKKKNKLVKS